MLQIAVSAQQRQQGLMHRAQLASDAGMLFIYPRRGKHRIWMKNTWIPLTVIWLDDELRVIHVELLQPCRQRKCPVFSAPRPSRYILELHSAQVERFRVGQRLSGLRTALP